MFASPRPPALVRFLGARPLRRVVPRRAGLTALAAALVAGLVMALPTPASAADRLGPQVDVVLPGLEVGAAPAGDTCGPGPAPHDPGPELPGHPISHRRAGACAGLQARSGLRQRSDPGGAVLAEQHGERDHLPAGRPEHRLVAVGLLLPGA